VTVAVFDIDGVVADVRHRLHYLDGHRKDWRRFHGAAGDDPPLPEGLALVADLAARHDIVWLSGRPEWLRGLTTEWLTEHQLPPTEIYLRGDADRRPARVFKLGVLRSLAPRAVAAFVDDDHEVVQSAAAAGYPAVLADWVPRSSSLRDAQERWGRA
jgi:phosphoglycolate phosphatase-like HAD superfamily hydrolase